MSLLKEGANHDGEFGGAGHAGNKGVSEQG